MARNFYRDIIRLLKENGYSFYRGAKGSHEIWVNQSNGKKLIIPYNLDNRHTANEILKEAGINKKF